MDHPRVSVIIASFNRADLLGKALESAINQEYPDFEILVVDDGSDDHSIEVIETLLRREPDRVRLIEHAGHEHKGIRATYDLGIAHARGEFAAFLEHDDCWPADYLGRKVKIFSDHPEVGVVCSPYRVVGERWYGTEMVLRQILLSRGFRKEEAFDNFGHLLRFNNVATFSCFMTRLQLLKQVPAVSQPILFYDWWLLLHLSTLGLFYADRRSSVDWRFSRHSALGELSIQEHRDVLCEFLELAHASIAAGLERLSGPNRKRFERHAKGLPHFLAYYRKPGMTNLFDLLRHSPSWASEAALSVLVNRIKYSR